MTDTRPNTKADSTAEPARGTVGTQTRYRDRPSDDGKYGDGAAEPRPEADRRTRRETDPDTPRGT